MKRRKQGRGSLFHNGRTWWMQYYVRGARFKESTGTADRAAAEEVLKRRLAEVTLTELDDIRPDQATIADLCQLVLTDYRLRGLRDTKTVQWRYQKNILPALGSIPARRASQQPKIFRTYIEDRQKAGAENATINRELAIVRRAFTLAMREDPPLVRKEPYIPQLEEDNVRQGFLEHEGYEQLLGELPERLKALFVCAYHTGTRKNELRRITWDQVDFEAMVIRLAGRQTKNKKPRELPIFGDMERWLRYQQEMAPKGNPFVFHGERGRPIGNALLGWHEAVERAGFEGLLLHDMRRSAVCNLKRARVQDTVAMKMSGHLTREIFDWYNITDTEDMEDAGEKVTAYFAKRKQDRAAKLRRVK
jgi:integrase